VTIRQQYVMKVGRSITLQQSARFSQNCNRPGTSIKDSLRYNNMLQHATGAAITRLQLIHRNAMENPFAAWNNVKCQLDATRWFIDVFLARHVSGVRTRNIVASSWYFTLFHDEDARSNKPQIPVYCFWISGLFRKIVINHHIV
jgi:hypothetical protein